MIRPGFYGWKIVIASLFCYSTSVGQFTVFALSIFLIPLQAEFGWQRGDILEATFYLTLTQALMNPVMGRLIDLYGVRKVLIPTMLIYGLLLGAIPFTISDYKHIYFIFAMMGVVGAGSAAIPYLRVAGAWFFRNRGLAFGVTISGGALGYAYTPILVQYMIDHHGWRSGYYALSTLVLFAALPLAYLMLRNKPADLNLFPDGDLKSQISENSDTEDTLDFHWSDLVKMKIFYQLFVIFLFMTFCLYGLMTNLVPMLNDRGMTSSMAVSVAAALATSMLFSRIAVGYLLDRYFAPKVAMVCVTFAIFGIALLASGVTGMGAFVAAIFIGVSIGAEFDILAYLITRYFGLQNFGMVYGILFSSFLIGVSIGPKSFGEAFDAQGSYYSILIASCIILAITVLMLWRLPKYENIIKSNDENTSKII